MARNVLSQIFDIIPCGLIRGGCLTYTVAPDIGLIHYQGEIKLKHWWRTRTHKFGGQQRINPAILESARVRTQQVIYVRRIRMVIESVVGSQVEVPFSYDGAYPGLGLAVFEMGQTYLKLKSVRGDGRVRHQSIFGTEHVYLNLRERPDNGNANH